MTNMIISISVPVGSLAASQIALWKDEALNVSDLIRTAIETYPKMDAYERKITALGWALSRRGICPVSMTPEKEADWKTGDLIGDSGPHYATPHFCPDCREFNGTPTDLENAGKNPVKVQQIVGPLETEWRAFPWRRA